MSPGQIRTEDESARYEVRSRASSQAFPNPERGFYAPRMSHRMGRLDGLRKRNITLLLIEIDLRDFQERELSPE